MKLNDNEKKEMLRKTLVQKLKDDIVSCKLTLTENTSLKVMRPIYGFQCDICGDYYVKEKSFDFKVEVPLQMSLLKNHNDSFPNYKKNTNPFETRLIESRKICKHCSRNKNDARKALSKLVYAPIIKTKLDEFAGKVPEEYATIINTGFISNLIDEIC